MIEEAIVMGGHRGIRATRACPNCVSKPVRVESVRKGGVRMWGRGHKGRAGRH